jgi:hypothetical protein
MASNDFSLTWIKRADRSPASIFTASQKVIITQGPERTQRKTRMFGRDPFL